MPPPLAAFSSIFLMSTISMLTLLSRSRNEHLTSEWNMVNSCSLSWPLKALRRRQTKVAKVDSNDCWSRMLTKYVYSEHGRWQRDGGGSERKNLVDNAILHYFLKNCTIQIYFAIFSNKVILFCYLIYVSNSVIFWLKSATYIRIVQLLF